MGFSWRRALPLLALVVSLASLPACSASLPTGPDAWLDTYGDLSSIAAQVVEQTNRERTAHGLPPLVLDERLIQAARIQADQMAAAGRLEHTLPEAAYPTLASRIDAVGYRSRGFAENIAAGYMEVESLMQGWMTSEGHRNIILHRDLREIGVAAAVAANGRIYYASVFGVPH